MKQLHFQRAIPSLWIFNNSLAAAHNLGMLAAHKNQHARRPRIPIPLLESIDLGDLHDE
jgi:hypothetical protein